MSLLEKRTPFQELDDVDRRVRRFFEGIGVTPVPMPPADVYETESELVVELEVPGFDEKEIDVQVREHLLAIKGERTDTADKSEKAIRLRERLDRRFERRFELPAQTDTEHVTAEYAKGVLTVHVPKTSSVKPRKIQVARV